MIILHIPEYIIEKTTESEQQLHDKDDLANNYHCEKWLENSNGNNELKSSFSRLITHE